MQRLSDDSNDAAGGIGTDGAAFSATTQIAYAPENWGIAAAYTKAGATTVLASTFGNANPGAASCFRTRSSQHRLLRGLSAWWTPEESGWIPSISTGYWAKLMFDDAKLTT